MKKVLGAVLLLGVLLWLLQPKDDSPSRKQLYQAEQEKREAAKKSEPFKKLIDVNSRRQYVAGLNSKTFRDLGTVSAKADPEGRQLTICMNGSWYLIPDEEKERVVRSAGTLWMKIAPDNAEVLFKDYSSGEVLARYNHWGLRLYTPPYPELSGKSDSR